MLLETAIKTLETNKNIDILELLGIELDKNFKNESYYGDNIKKLSNNKVFLSDLDGTFFRKTMTQEIFSLFLKFIKSKDITRLEKERVKDFLDDYYFFQDLEKKAYNKQIDYSQYTLGGTFLMFKYRHLIEWEEFLWYVKNSFLKKEKINPFRFSLHMMKKTLESGNDFVFISGAPNFALEIYLELLKDFIFKETGVDYSRNIHGFGTFFGVNNSHYVPLFSDNQKDNFIKYLKKEKNNIEFIGGMGDTSADYGISRHLEKNSQFYFINPEAGVFEKFDEFSKKDISYHFIIERKDLIFEIDRRNLNPLIL